MTGEVGVGLSTGPIRKPESREEEEDEDEEEWGDCEVAAKFFVTSRLVVANVIDMLPPCPSLSCNALAGSERGGIFECECVSEYVRGGRKWFCMTITLSSSYVTLASGPRKPDGEREREGVRGMG